MPATRRLPLLAAAALSALIAVSACQSPAGSSSAPDDDTLDVIAAFYPLQYAAQSVGAGAATVSTLTPPGVEPHDLELSAAQVGRLAEADLVLYVKGLQPAVDEAIADQAADHAIDVTAALSLLPSTEDAGASDPHVWLDPSNMGAIGTTIAQRLAELAPEQADALRAREQAFTSAMSDLDEQFAHGLATCAIRDMVVSHEAFGYLASAYGLQQVGLSGLSPDAEPSPARMREVADLVRAEGITTIYYETLVDPKVAQTLADETGAQSAVLDPLEGAPADPADDYATIMLANLATLAAGQGCS